jgi:glutamate---cysteine ligase / carboxylate-amine ligase
VRHFERTACRTQQDWEHWTATREHRYTIGVEEEAMLLDVHSHALAQRAETVIDTLEPSLVRHLSPETHSGVLELKTGVHERAGRATSELAGTRRELSRQLRPLGLCAAAAGCYPLQAEEPVGVSSSPRYRALEESLRTLVHRAPTMALHVHVGVPDPEDAVVMLGRLSAAVPLLIALSANSPICEGRDGGFASERIAIFQAFPRTGIARQFESYADYVASIGTMIDACAIPDPTFLWWDVRLNPAIGTVEVRAMDAQIATADNAGIIALVQCLARLSLEDEPLAPRPSPEVLTENRFLAARDGLDAVLIDPERSELVPVRETVELAVRRCRPHAAVLGCSLELEHVLRLAAFNGAARQRRAMLRGGPTAVATMLAAAFDADSRQPSAPHFTPPAPLEPEMPATVAV